MVPPFSRVCAELNRPLPLTYRLADIHLTFTERKEVLFIDFDALPASFLQDSKGWDWLVFILLISGHFPVECHWLRTNGNLRGTEGVHLHRSVKNSAVRMNWHGLREVRPHMMCMLCFFLNTIRFLHSGWVKERHDSCFCFFSSETSSKESRWKLFLPEINSLPPKGQIRDWFPSVHFPTLRTLWSSKTFPREQWTEQIPSWGKLCAWSTSLSASHVDIISINTLKPLSTQGNYALQLSTRDNNYHYYGSNMVDTFLLPEFYNVNSCLCFVVSACHYFRRRAISVYIQHFRAPKCCVLWASVVSMGPLKPGNS